MPHDDQHRSIPAVIDFEASGFGRNSYPIEVGYVLPDGRRYCTLIRPLESWTHWDKAAAAIHGVSRDKLLQHGRSPAEVCDQLDRDLEGRVVYTDAWSFDLSWLHSLYDATDRTPGFRLESLRALLSDDEVAVWHTMLSAVRHDFDGARHRASIDAAAIQKAVCRLRGITPPTAQEDAGLA